MTEHEFDMELSKLHLEDDDVLVIKAPKSLQPHVIDHIRNLLRSHSSQRVLVFDTDIELESLSRKEQVRLLHMLIDRLFGDEASND